MKLTTKIVGLQHKGITPEKIKNHIKTSFFLETEPTNNFDPYAVKCISNNEHIGYIEKIKSKEISALLNKGNKYQILVLSHDNYQISIEIEFSIEEEKRVEMTFDGLPDGGVPGIYKISFEYEKDQWCYIGQSKNINKRLSVHVNNLNNIEHHNTILQSAWIDNPASFSYKILEIAPSDLSALGIRIFLFEKEMEYIEKSKNTANRIAADLVLDDSSKVEFKYIIDHVKEKVKNQREVLVNAKSEVGQLFFDAGIMDESSGRHHKVKKTNVLTWLNKTRYSPYDFLPPINRSHSLYNALYKTITDFQKKIKENEQKKIFSEEFYKSIKRKGKYETCSLDELNYFIRIFREFKKFDIKKSEKEIFDELLPLREEVKKAVIKDETINKAFVVYKEKIIGVYLTIAPKSHLHESSLGATTKNILSGLTAFIPDISNSIAPTPLQDGKKIAKNKLSSHEVNKIKTFHSYESKLLKERHLENIHKKEIGFIKEIDGNFERELLNGVYIGLGLKLN